MKYHRLAIVLLLTIFISCNIDKDEHTYSWESDVDSDWVGANFWANRLQDWQVKNGRLECIQDSEKKPMRTVHLVTGRLTDPEEFSMSVQTGPLVKNSTSNTAASGFLIGAGASLDYRAAALIHHSPGQQGGYFLGLRSNGELFIQDFNNPTLEELTSTMIEELPNSYSLEVSGNSTEEGYTIVISVLNDDNVQLGSLTYSFKEFSIQGNVALVSHPGKGEETGSFWFNNWTVSGDSFEFRSERQVGPIISSQYTYSNNILKINAQFMPIGKADNQDVILEIKKTDDWQEVAVSTIKELSYNAGFRVPDFEIKEVTPYRIGYQQNENHRIIYFEGTIRPDPVDKEEIVIAGFTGNHNLAKGVERSPFNWKEQIWFPHNQLVQNVVKHQPDLLFFSGDQIYEGASPSGADRANIYRDYMYKWYLWCWAYSDITKDLPTVTIPDDHDVFQGNVWGNGGGDTPIDTEGGYVHGAKFVKMVERTQVSHLPDPFDPTPIRTGIGTYYTTLNLGEISFAIIEDRKFKSGPKGLVTPTKSGRPDHVVDPNYTYEMADVPGATLLGERQLKYLDYWAADWKGADMKIVLSQTIFGNMATHHGAGLKHLYMDFDSNGWPQTGRNKALKVIRKGYGFMLGGDQHLASIVHHGVEAHNDAGWSFCVPSIANFYPRAWQPFQEYGDNYVEGLQKYTGEYLDGLGNKVTVYAHTNPGLDTGIEPKALHNRMPGYGIVKMNKNQRTITMECWPRYVDPLDPSTGQQYTGWPRTISQFDNYNRKAEGWLPTVSVLDSENPVIQVIQESTGEIIYTLRIKGSKFEPRVFEAGLYTLKISQPDQGLEQVFEGLKSSEEQNSSVLDVAFDIPVRQE